MDLKRGLKNIFNSVVGQLPVIGPHDGIEADLMLAGKKPITWQPVWPDEDIPDDPRKKAIHEGRKKLDEAVRQGKLKSIDVVMHRDREPPYDADSKIIETPPAICRHYCQPGKEEDMKLLAAFHTKVFNFEAPDVKLQKDLGKYLGYRDRDIGLWKNDWWPVRKASIFVGKHVHSSARREKMLRVIDKTRDRVHGFIQPRIKAAYQQNMLHQIEKAQKKADKAQKKNDKNQPKF